MYEIPTQGEFFGAADAKPYQIVDEVLKQVHDLYRKTYYDEAGRPYDPFDDGGKVYFAYITILHTRNGTIK